MEGIQIMEDDKTSDVIDFDYDENISKSYHKIKMEYQKKGKWIITILSAILITLIIYFTTIYPIYLIPDEGATITGLSLYRFNFTINWTIFSIGTFTIFYLLKILFMRITPFLQEQIKNEVNALGFSIQEKRRSWILFLILNSISILLLFLIELNIIFINHPVFNALFKVILLVYLFISFLIPIFWRFSYDGLIIRLKEKYYISINPYYRIRKIKAEDSQLIGIFLFSNKIANKFDKYKKSLYNQISESRWLPRKRKSITSKYGLNFFLRFYEFSTPVNFQKQFLNIVIALREWDEKVSGNLDENSFL
jgi:hypothetical protein